MKIKYYFPFFLVSCSLFSCKKHEATNKHIGLGDNWKYKIIEWKSKPNDPFAFASSSYNDSSWSYLLIDTSIERQGFSYSEKYCWYRKKVFLSSNLAKHAYLKDSLKIYLGMIGTYDQTFLNGNFIGQNGRCIPIGTPLNDTFASDTSAKNVNKAYYLSIKDKRILWDTINLVAIRVYDTKVKRGSPYISMKGIEDYIEYNKSSFYVPDNSHRMDTVLRIRNVSPKLILKGKMNFLAKDAASGDEVYSKNASVSLSPGAVQLIPVSLPVSTNYTKFYIQFHDKTSKSYINDSILIPFVLTK